MPDEQSSRLAPDRLRSRVRSVAVVATLTHVVIALLHGGPVAVPDVPAYLSVAQWIHGGLLPTDLNYHPGFGILLAPFGWVSGDTLHSITLIINGLLAGLLVMLAASYARLLGLSDRTVVVVACMAALHPSVAVSSRIAWPETLLAVVVLCTALTVHTRKWALAGLIATLSVCLHPRMIVVAAALLLAAGWGREFRKIVATVLAAAVLVIIVLSVTNTWPDARIQAAQSMGAGPSPISTCAGQWLGLVAGTAGLAGVAVFQGIRDSIRRRVNPDQLFLVASALGMLILGGWVLAGSDRPDTLLYNRYMGPWAVPLSVAGISAVSRSSVPRWHLALVSFLSFCAFGVIAAEMNSVGEPIRRIMTLDLAAIWVVTNNRLAPALLTTTVFAILGTWFLRRSLVIGLALLLTLSAASTLVSHVNLHDVGNVSDGQSTTAALVPEDTTCLTHDSSAKSYALWLYRLQLPSVQHLRIDVSGGTPPCGELVVASKTAFELCLEAQLLAAEPRGGWGLWRYPREGCG